MRSPEEIIGELSGEMEALANAHYELGAAIARQYYNRGFTVEEAAGACALAAEMLELLKQDPIEVGLALIGKLAQQQAEVDAFRKALDDLPEAA